MHQYRHRIFDRTVIATLAVGLSLDRLRRITQPPPAAHCTAIKRKIDNLRKDLDERWKELDLNPQNLPERIGPGELLHQTRRNHRTLINMRERDLRHWEDRYDKECGDDDDSGGSCGTGCAAVTSAAVVAASLGVGYVAYRCIRMLPSLAPPFWWTIPANIAAP